MEPCVLTLWNYVSFTQVHWFLTWVVVMFIFMPFLQVRVRNRKPRGRRHRNRSVMLHLVWVNVGFFFIWELHCVWIYSFIVHWIFLQFLPVFALSRANLNGQGQLWDRLKVMMTSSNGNIFHVTGPLWGNPPVTWSFDVSLMWASTNGWVNTQDDGDLRHQGPHCNVTVMVQIHVTIADGHWDMDYTSLKWINIDIFW